MKIRYFLIPFCWIMSLVIGTVLASSMQRDKMFAEIYGESMDYMLVNKNSAEQRTNPYAAFIDDEMAQFIIECSESFNVDTNLVMAILEKENPLLVKDAVSKPNVNGTRDIGLFQLNDRYLYAKDGFLDKYWNDALGEFNADNWKNNSYVAIKLLGDLEKMFGKGNVFWIACAYNAGPQRAYKEWTRRKGDESFLPETVLNNYAPVVVNNYQKWKVLTD